MHITGIYYYLSDNDVSLEKGLFSKGDNLIKSSVTKV